jgi:hypothetical protein
VTEPLPLAAAAVRLRGKPGRPRLSDEEKARRTAKGAESRRARRAALLATVPQRLFSIPASAIYLGGVSEWTVRDLIANGTIPTVVIPGPNLDRLIAAWKERA